MPRLRTFEGRELEQLLDHVQATCGPDAAIVSANRVRRGGVKGFFATEVFELVVEDPSDGPDDATAEAGSDTGSEAVARAGDGAVTELAGPTDPADPSASVEDLGEATAADTDVYDEDAARRREERFAAALADALDSFEDVNDAEAAPAPVAESEPARRPAPALVGAAGAPVATTPEPAPATVPAAQQAVAEALAAALAARPTPAPVAVMTPPRPGPVDDLATSLLAAPTPAAEPPVGPRAVDPGPTPRPAPAAPVAEAPVTAGAAAATRPAAPRPLTPRPLAAGPVPTLWELLDRYTSLPTLTERPPAGVTVVVGAEQDVLVAAAGVAARAGLDPTQVLVATADPSLAVAPWQRVGSPAEAAERTASLTGRTGARTKPRVVLAVACTDDEADRRWADAVIEAVGAVRRHVALPARAGEAEAAALAGRFGADAIDLVGLDDAATPDELCRLGIPVTTLEGHPATPALWAALAVERSCRVPA